MVTVVAEVPGVAVYMDDIVIHGPDWATYDQKLNEVFPGIRRDVRPLPRERMSSGSGICQVAFHKLKQLVTSALILAHFRLRQTLLCCVMRQE